MDRASFGKHLAAVVVVMLGSQPATLLAAGGPLCAERADTCDQTITALPATLATANRTYCIASAVSGSGALTISADNIKVVGLGKTASAVVAGADIVNRTCVTLKNIHFSSGFSFSGGSSNRLIGSAIEGSFGFSGATHHNLVQGTDIRPSACSQEGVGFYDGVHHNVFSGNSVIKDETAPFQCVCRRLGACTGNVTIDYKCGGNRYFHVVGASDNEIIGNDIRLTNPKNNGGATFCTPTTERDAEIGMASYGGIRTIWRDNNFYFKLDPYAGGYGFYIRDGTANNLMERNTFLQDSNVAPAVTFASGARPGLLTDNMFRSNVIKSSDNRGHGALFLQNLGKVNYFVGNQVWNPSGDAIIAVNWVEGLKLFFQHNSAYSSGLFFRDDSGIFQPSTTRAIDFHYNVAHTSGSNVFGVGQPAQWSADANLFYRSGSTSSALGVSSSLLGSYIWADPLYVNAASSNLNLGAGSPARADTSGSDAVTIDYGALPTSPDTVVPQPPSVINAQNQLSGTQALLTWSGASDNRRVVSYQVSRSVGDGTNYEFLVETPQLAYTDPGLNASTAYFYRVRSVDLAGNLSAFSAAVSINGGVVDPVAPAAPANLTLQ